VNSPLEVEGNDEHALDNIFRAMSYSLKRYVVSM
jgi:hypothetical protein